LEPPSVHMVLSKSPRVEILRDIMHLIF
jgi:hypothetical protein